MTPEIWEQSLWNRIVAAQARWLELWKRVKGEATK